MNPEGGKAIGGAGSPGAEGAYATGSVIAVESAPCEVLDGEGACWVTVVAAVGAFAEPVPPAEGMQKPKRERCLCQGKNIGGRDGDRW